MPHEERSPDEVAPDPPPQRDLLDELERADLAVEAQGIEEERTMFDPKEPPKAPHPREEGITSLDGSREVDLQRDTMNLDDLTTSVDPGHGDLLDEVDLRDLDLL